MKRILKASVLGLILAVAAGCPTPGTRASADASYVKAPATPAPAEAPAAE